MSLKNIALIGYTSRYFFPFCEALERVGFNVFWVCSNLSDVNYLLNEMSISEERVLNVNEVFDEQGIEIDACRKSLKSLEFSGRPRVYDIIQMDRILRLKPPHFSLKYINCIYKRMEQFFIENQVSMISSGRDTALQLTSMMVARKLDIPWVVPTRLRIPLETYGFCTGHETDTFITFRETKDEEDHVWAKKVLSEFNDSCQRPALKIAARNFKDTVKLLKPHFVQFLDLLKRSRLDKGNNYSRYTIPKIIQMYIQRRINMAALNLVKPWAKPSETPFCIYALHTQPESSIDVAGSFFSDQIALISFISRSLPVSHELYVKIHPTDIDGKTLSFYRKILKIPAVRLIHDDVASRELVNKASIIFTLTGTIGYEAGLLGKSVITFARNYYNSLPTVQYCDNPPELLHLIDNALNAVLPDDWREQVIEWLCHYRARVFDGEVNRMFGENPRDLLKEDLQVLQEAYEILFQKLVVFGGHRKSLTS